MRALLRRWVLGSDAEYQTNLQAAERRGHELGFDQGLRQGWTHALERLEPAFVEQGAIPDLDPDIVLSEDESAIDLDLRGRIVVRGNHVNVRGNRSHGIVIDGPFNDSAITYNMVENPYAALVIDLVRKYEDGQP